MARSTPRTSYRLTADLVAAHAGASGIVCLDASAEGRSQPLHAKRPDASTNRSARAELARLRGENVYGPQGVYAVEPPAPAADVLLVCIDGPIEERSGFHDPCGGWTDGHDAIYERLAAAFEIGDVVLCGKTPGGAVSGGPEFMRRAAEMKRKHGRRCIGHTEAMVASMGLWWFAAICDEIHVSPDARIGAAGARAAHASIAGALAKEGVAFTFAAWPDEGKIAGVPELPLSDVGKARMDRDVSIAGEMFAAVVAASPTSRRAGLTRDSIAALRADALTGQAAVDAGLADSVATLEDVMAYALATAGTGATMDDPEKDKDKPEGEDDPKPAKDEEAAAYCSKCGTAIVPPEKGEDDAPPSSKPAPKKDEARATVATAPQRFASVAAILGLPASASAPAIMTALVTAKRSLDGIAAEFGRKPAANLADACATVALDITEHRRGAESAERLALCKRYAAAKGERNGYLADLEIDGRRVTVPGDLLAGLSMGKLRDRVTDAEKTAKAPRNPFAADPARAKDATAKAAHGDAAEAAKNNPAVALAARGGVAPDVAADIHAREFGGQS